MAATRSGACHSIYISRQSTGSPDFTRDAGRGDDPKAEGVGSQEQPQVVADLEQNLERAKRYVTDI